MRWSEIPVTHGEIGGAAPWGFRRKPIGGSGQLAIRLMVQVDGKQLARSLFQLIREVDLAAKSRRVPNPSRRCDFPGRSHLL